MTRRTWLMLLLLAALAGAAWLAWQRYQQPAPGPVDGTLAPIVPPADPADPAASRVRPPLEPLPPDQEPPALDESDVPLQQSLDEMIGAGPLEQVLIPDELVRRAVVFIDNLDRRPIRMRHWPLRHVPGPPQIVTAPDGGSLWSLDNSARYAPYVQALESISPSGFAGVYRRYYPLLQQAWEELGHAGSSFHERLLQVLDHLLATPRVTYPLELKREKVLYQFADPRLEALSWGQKAILRAGPGHRPRIDAMLRELRAAVVATAEAPASGPAPAPDAAPDAELDTEPAPAAQSPGAAPAGPGAGAAD